MSNLVQDLRFAFRMLVKSPLMTGAAVLSLALGIGANAAIFSLLNAFFLRGLPVAEPERLVAIFTSEEAQQFGRFMPISRPNYLDVRELDTAFEDVADFLLVGAALVAEGGEPEQVRGQLVSSNYFSTLGVDAEVGRVFVDRGQDEAAGAEPVVVLAHDFWSRRFGADPDAVGRVVQLNGHAFTVVGVAPAGFQGTFLLGGPDFWAPVSMHRELLTGAGADNFDDRRALITVAFGRLAAGVGIEEAQAAVHKLAAALREEHPVENRNRDFLLVPLVEAALNPNARDNFSRAGAILMGAVGLVLLIACANVANLLLGRAASRRREIGVRRALGASRWSVVRQLLVESLLLAVTAGVAGLVVGVWARNALWALRPPFLQDTTLDLGFDLRVLGFLLLVTLATGLLFGLAPAIQASRARLVEDLGRASDGATGSGRTWSFRNVLVMAQVALSLVALVSSGLFLASLGRATRTDLGYDPARLGTLTVNLAQAGYDPARGEPFFDRLLERVRAVPGVEAATLTTAPPLSGGGFWRTVIVEERPDDAENNRILVPVNTVDTDYFATTRSRLLAGRDLAASDRADSLPVVVVNQAMAKLFWPDLQSPVGQRFHFFGQEVVREVVGMVSDVKYLAIGEDPQAQVYVPRRQSYEPAMALAFRAQGDPEALLGTLREEVHALDAHLAITNVQTGEDAVRQGLWAARMGAGLLGVLGVLALVLAAVGIYGVMAYTVSQRDREISVRMAMGADRSAIVRMVLGQGMRVVGVGLGVGLVAAALVGRSIAGLLYGVSPTDPQTFGLTAGTLAVAALAANLFPALRATAVDPVAVLRFER